MKYQKAIYPDVKIESDMSGVKVETYLRKEHEGKWYLWGHVCKRVASGSYFKSTGEMKDAIIACLNELHKSVYLSSAIGVISKNIVGYDGEPIFKEDESQKSERERLRSLNEQATR